MKIINKLIYSCLILIPCIAFSNQVTNNEKRVSSLIPRSVLFQQKTKRCVSLSPNGQFVAYVAPDEFGNSYLWIKELFSTKNVKKIIPYKNSDGIREMRWQFDNKYILIANDENMNANVHLYQIQIETGQIKDLTPLNNIFTKIIAYHLQHPNNIIVQLFPMNLNEDQKKNYKCPGLHKINLETGEMTLYSENPGNVAFWGIDNELNLSCILSTTEDNQVHITVKDNKNWRHLISKGRDGNKDGITSPFIGFSKDNSELYLLSDLQNDTVRLLKVNLHTGNYEILAEDPQYDFCSANIFSEENSTIQFAAIIREKFEQIAIDPNSSTALKVLQNLYPGIIRILATDLSSHVWLVLHESDKCPPHYFVYDVKTQAVEPLFSENESIGHYLLNDTTSINFSAQDGMKIFGYLTLPQSIEAKNLPAIILVHGGPWARDYWEFNPMVQALANRGYAVLQVNYRGSSGYGKKYMHAGFLEMGGKISQDLIDGKNWLIEKGYIDPTRVAIMGHSFGGYNTLAGLIFTPDEFCCGIDLAGPTDLVEMVGKMSGVGSSWWHRYFGKEEEFLKSRSPLCHINKITKPLMVIDGVNDLDECKGEKMVQIMREHHLPVTHVVFLDEGHVIAKPKNQRKLFAAIESFLSAHLKGNSVPISLEDDFSELIR
ncbi:S9 family peptidase [Parachlamydia sp. AcF125]|uniref:alpha/beta hydrolase family protein n=1 Tax=Parachlamydia sp. AcF125 TaxID=2795736 RepID=UPI001BC8D597|nr:S9 family peptidase [Parachlamydia sp. AcF125]MBS4168997.1 Dipeptidyl aminopeptidase BIII [Parachlamydia sp. AcF125]